MRLVRCPQVRLSLLPFAFVVLGIGIITAIETLRNTVVVLTVVGVFFAEGVDEAKVEHAMSSAGPVILLPDPWFILAELFDDAQTTFDFLETLLVSSPMKCESYQVW